MTLSHQALHYKIKCIRIAFSPVYVLNMLWVQKVLENASGLPLGFLMKCITIHATDIHDLTISYTFYIIAENLEFYKEKQIENFNIFYIILQFY